MNFPNERVTTVSNTPDNPEGKDGTVQSESQQTSTPPKASSTVPPKTNPITLAPPTEEDSESVDSVTASFSSILEASLEQPTSVPLADISEDVGAELGPEDIPTDIDDSWDVLDTEAMPIDEKVQTGVPEAFASNHFDSEEWGMLHPYSLLINLLPQMMRTIQNAWPLLLFILLGDSTGQQIFDSIFVLFFVALSVIRTLIHFLTLRYRIQDGKLIVKMGLIFRQARTLDPARIQNMEITQNLLHKYFNLVELKIETAGDASTKGLLSALSREDADYLKRALQHSKRSKRSVPIEEQEYVEPSLSLSWQEIILFGLSRRTVGTIVVLSAIASEAMSVASPDQAQYVANSMSLQLFIGLMAISFAASWIWSSMQAILQYYRLQLRIFPDEIGIVSGLITKRSVEIPTHKVQTIEWFEPWLRRQMGFGTLYLETAALGMADGEVRRSEGVVPMVYQEELENILGQIAPTTSKEILNATTYKPHKHARFVIIFGYLFPATLALFFAWWSLELTPMMLSLVGILVLMIVAGLTELDFQMQRWAVTPHGILSREGYINRRTYIVDREKVQSVYRSENPLLQLLGLSQVVIRVAGSTVRLPLLPKFEAETVLENLTEDWRK
jgi:putative membrane protein